jgi:hypothetical protein
VLQRVPNNRYRLNYNIMQRWVKNNGDPENIVFGSAGRQNKKSISNDAAFLLVMAIGNSALLGFETLDNL